MTNPPPPGSNGFGFDCVVIPDGQDPGIGGGQRALAEMTADEKNAISHRFRALRELFEQLSVG